MWRSLFAKYATDPKPVIWNSTYHAARGRTAAGSAETLLSRIALESRARRYAKIAHVTIPFDDHKRSRRYRRPAAGKRHEDTFHHLEPAGRCGAVDRIAWPIWSTRYPEARFTIACGPYAAGLFRAVPGLQRLIVLEKKSWNRHWIALWKAVASARAGM